MYYLNVFKGWCVVCFLNNLLQYYLSLSINKLCNNTFVSSHIINYVFVICFTCR